MEKRNEFIDKGFSGDRPPTESQLAGNRLCDVIQSQSRDINGGHPRSIELSHADRRIYSDSSVPSGRNFPIEFLGLRHDAGALRKPDDIHISRSESDVRSSYDRYQVEYKSFSIASEILNERLKIRGSTKELNQDESLSNKSFKGEHENSFQNWTETNLHCDERLTDSGEAQPFDDEDDDEYDDAFLKESDIGDDEHELLIQSHQNQIQGQKFSEVASPDTNTEDLKRNLSCHECPFIGTNGNDFANHMAIHGIHACTMCDYISTTTEHLLAHVQEVHGHGPNGSEAQLDYVPIRDSGRRRNYQCRHCEFSSTDRDIFWAHKAVHIPSDRLLRCPHAPCQFVTDLKHHLDYHLSNHSGEKPFKCEKCDYSCVNKSMLNSHMKSHSNYYPYRCFDCSFASKYPHPMKLHEEKRGHHRMRVLPGDDMFTRNQEESKPIASENMGNLLEALDSEKKRRKRSIVEDLNVESLKTETHCYSGISDNLYNRSNPQALLQPQHTPNAMPIPFTGFPGPVGGMWPGFVGRPQTRPGWIFPSYYGIGIPPAVAAFNAINAMNIARLFSPRLPEICAAPMQAAGPILRPVIPPVPSPFKMSRASSDLEVIGNSYSNQSPYKLDQSRSFSRMNHLTCTMCSFSTSVPLRLLEHTMNAHSESSKEDKKMSSREQLKTENYMPTFEQPLLQSTPQKPQLQSSVMRNPEDLSKYGSINQQQGKDNNKNNKNAVHEKKENGADNEENGSGKEREHNRRNLTVDTSEGKNLTTTPKAVPKPPSYALAAKRSSTNIASNYESVSDIKPLDDDDYSISTGNLLNTSTEKLRRHRPSRADAADHLDSISFRLQNKQVSQNSKNSLGTSESISPIETSASSGGEGLSPLGSSDVTRDISKKSDDKINKTQTGRTEITYSEEPEDLSVGRNRANNELTPTSPSIVAINQCVARRLENTFKSESSRLENTFESRNRNSIDSDERSPTFGSTSSYDASENSTESLGKYKHECIHCGLTFKDFAMYSIHMGYHGLPNPFMCNMCGEITNDKVDFFIHIAKSAHIEKSC